MTTKPDLLPLRDWMECLGEANAEDIRDYARANVAHATSAKAAENEALRAEVERANGWNERVSVCRDHVADIVDGPCVICALDAAEAHADKLRAEVDMLRGKVDEAVVELLCRKARAERLAEALETCLEVEERPSIIEMARVALRDHDQEGK